jgi:hypothetical protein
MWRSEAARVLADLQRARIAPLAARVAPTRVAYLCADWLSRSAGAAPCASRRGQVSLAMRLPRAEVHAAAPVALAAASLSAAGTYGAHLPGQGRCQQCRNAGVRQIATHLGCAE